MMLHLTCLLVFFTFISDLIQLPIWCLLILKTILLMGSCHYLPGSQKLVPEALLEPCHLFFISVCCCCSHFSVLQKWMHGRCVHTLLLKNSCETLPYEITKYFWWISCSYRKATTLGFYFRQGLGESATVRELSEIQMWWLFLYWYVNFSADLINVSIIETWKDDVGKRRCR